MEKEVFNSQLEGKVLEIEKIIEKYLPKEEGYQKIVFEAMNYSVRAGGKRLRPMFISETYKLFGGDKELVEPFMAALEMIHTYSLVHDDLPAMDNDKYRRGRLSTWAMYDEPMAILAGDGLLNFAFETALKAFSFAKDASEYERVAKAMTVLAGKAGIYGMIGGQVLDVNAEKQERSLNLEEILFVHEYKTAALIQCGLMIGAILAGASDEEISALEKIGLNVGIAFQIQDDILDVIGDTEVLGKQVGSDASNNKQTYVTLNGLEKSKEDVRVKSEESIKILETLPGDKAFLRELILSLINRVK